MEETKARDFFLSYNNEADGEIASWIAETLTACGKTIYFQKDDCKPGMNFTRWMREAIQYSKAFLAVWSPAYEQSGYCQEELDAADIRRHEDNTYQIIPLKVSPEPVRDPLLKSTVYADLTSSDKNQRRKVLLDALNCDSVNCNLSELHSSNDWFVQNFMEPLFLHRFAPYRNEKVNLTHLFIPHHFEGNNYGGVDTIETYLSQFIHNEQRNSPSFLFIEGDGGCGKSSLTSFLCYHWTQGDKTGQYIFGNCRPIAVRLRDIDIKKEFDEILPAERLFRALLRFLYPDETMDKRGDNQRLTYFRAMKPLVLLLDGFDELCAVPALSDSEIALQAVKGLTALQCKIIITTRPRYLNFGRLTVAYDRIALQHFDNEQRTEWIRRYETDCEEQLDDGKRSYLEDLKQDYKNTGDNATGICDTPMGLYMVASGHFSADVLENEWALYYQIFHREMLDRAYNDYATHPVGEDKWEYLYRFIEEAAWRLWQNGNEDLTIQDVDIREIVDSLFWDKSKDKNATTDRMDSAPDERTKEMVERCFALCGYWRTDTERGYAEFYHNNIRDFFICEKIARELNEAYGDYVAVLQKVLSESERTEYQSETELISFLERLCYLFQYGELESRVLHFLRLRATYLLQDRAGRGQHFPPPDKFVTTEQDFRPLPRIFQTLLLRGEPYSAHTKVNPVKMVQYVLYNCVSVYRQIYDAFLKENELVRWWVDVDHANEALRLINGHIFCNAGSSDLEYADLRGADLEHVDLRGANLTGADLRGADLTGINLQGTYLENADFQGSDLREANLRDAHLKGAHFRGAYLQGANLRDADFRSDLRGADLRDADLRGSNLWCVDLRRVDLRDADLQKANLQGADFRCADLEGADLQNAQLKGARFRCAHLEGADLRNADFYAANIKGAYLHNANLAGCNLSDAIGIPSIFD